MTNSVGVLKLAATVCPGSIWRASTTPDTGERITARSRLVIAEESCASAAATLACAELTDALSRATFASAASSSVREGTLPPETR